MSNIVICVESFEERILNLLFVCEYGNVFGVWSGNLGSGVGLANPKYRGLVTRLRGYEMRNVKCESGEMTTAQFGAQIRVIRPVTVTFTRCDLV